MSKRLKTAVIGCGLIGKRRAEQAVKHEKTQLDIVVDINLQNAEQLAVKYNCKSSASWQPIIDEVDIVIVSTPNALLTNIAVSALEKNKHVLIEKPMGCNFEEAKLLFNTAKKSKGLFKVGFNHRYHPAIQLLKTWLNENKIDEIINIRAVYGHGGRPGYEKEWRGDKSLAGGGELIDQGVHIIDLINWLMGKLPEQVFALLQNKVWPIAPLEDNGFALLKYSKNVVACFHTSWTQWKNKFLLEVFGKKGAIIVEGLGKSYGQETITLYQNKLGGGVPDQQTIAFPDQDLSWSLEWQDFVDCILRREPFLNYAQEGLQVMQTLQALYKSAELNQMIACNEVL